LTPRIKVYNTKYVGILKLSFKLIGITDKLSRLITLQIRKILIILPIPT